MLFKMCGGIATALMFSTAAGWAACQPGQSRNCLKLDPVPDLSQRVDVNEFVPPPTQRAREVEGKKAYTGPIVGVSPTVRQVPTIGYRWSLE